MHIDNKTAAVVTGGASGLGKASAQALAKAGVKVAIFDVNEAGGEAAAREPLPPPRRPHRCAPPGGAPRVR